MRHAVLGLVGLSCLVHLDLQAQQMGQPVRITSSRYELDRQTGRMLVAGGDTLVVQVQRMRTVQYRQMLVTGTLVLARAGIDRLELRQSGGRRTGRGALIGLGVGAVAGFLIGAAAYQDCSPEQSWACAFMPRSAGESGMLGAVGFGFTGAGLGALIGTFTHGTEWREVKIRGLGVAISF